MDNSAQKTTRYPKGYSINVWEKWERGNRRVIAEARHEADIADPLAWAVDHADWLIENIVDAWELAYTMRIRDRLQNLTDTSLDVAWTRLQAVLPEGWICEMYDSGPPNSFNPGPGHEFHAPRYHVGAKVGILSSPSKLRGYSDVSLTDAINDLIEKLRKEVT